MSTSLSLPPSQRDFQVYQRVVVEAVSTRQAAGEFSLSQTRIRQLVQRVSQWLTDNLPPQDDATDAAYLRHAQHVAADRLSFFYSVAMDGWRAERQLKYLNMAVRVAFAQSKLPVIPGTLECLAADAIEGPLPNEHLLSREQTCSRSVEQASSLVHGSQASGDAGRHCEELVPSVLAGNALTRGSTLAEAQTRQEPRDAGFPGGSLGTSSKENPNESPPLRDCSRSPQNNHSTAASSAAPPTARPTPESSSANLPPATVAARRAFFAPAQPAPLTGDLPVTELQITPQQLGLTSKKKLSRRERRKLRRAKASA